MTQNLPKKYKTRFFELYKSEELLFKKKYDIGIDDIDFFSSYENSRTENNNCESIFPSTFERILELSDCKNRDLVFMDCGSGLGLPVFIASHFFKYAYGVEVISYIAEKSKDNLKKLKVKNAKIISSDIQDISLEVVNSVNVFFLFNPFTSNIFSNFLKLVRNSLREKEREIIIIYANSCEYKLFNTYKSDFVLEKEISDFRPIKIYHHRKKMSL